MKRYFLVLLIALLPFFGTMYFVTPDYASVYVLSSCLAVFYLIFIHAIFRPIKIVESIPTYIKIEIFFLIFYYILFYYPYQLYLLGLHDLGSNSYLTFTFERQVNKSVILSTIGVISFYVGLIRRSQKNDFLFKSVFKNDFDKKLDKKIAVAILILLILFMGIYATTGLASMLSQAYIGANSGLVAQDSTSDGLYFLVNHFSSLAIAIIVIYYYKYRELKLYMIFLCCIAGGWSLLLLIIGDRNSFFIVAAMLIAGYYTLFKSIGRIRIVFFLLIALFVYQVIEISRQADERGFTAIFDAVLAPANDLKKDDSSFTITTITTRAAIDVVPDQMNYFLGKFKLIGFAGIVPYSRKILVDPNDDFVTSSDVLSYSILGPVRTWSVGSNIVSDIYLDFGVLGVVFLMYGLGEFASYITKKARRRGSSTLWLTLYILCVGLYSELPRYSYDFPVRNIVWTLFLFYAVRFLSARRGA